MPCLFAMFAGMFPRLGVLFIWLARPTQFSAAFNGSWFWPIVGIIFLPFTTLMFVILQWGARGLSGWDWFWLVLAVMIDVMHYTSTGYYNRERIPGYTEPATVSATATYPATTTSPAPTSYAAAPAPKPYAAPAAPVVPPASTTPSAPPPAASNEPPVTPEP